jgi:DNA polymerase elongation subunit (family B)
MKTSINFIPLEYDYFDFNGKNYLKIFGRDENNKRACIIDSFHPYLWVVFKSNTSENKINFIKEEIEKIHIKSESRESKVEKTEIHDKKFLGKDAKALKVYVTNYKDLHAVADQMDFPEIEARRGYDITLTTNYIIESNLSPLIWKKITGELLNNSQEFGNLDSSLNLDICIKVENIESLEETKQKELEANFQPEILAFDIETDDFEIGKGEILMISIYGKNVKKILTWKKTKELPDYVEVLKNEEEMLEAFVENIGKIKPDILVGYFSDGFDMPYLKARAEELGVKLSLGVDGSKPFFTRGKITSASIAGIINLDLFRFIETVFSQYLQSETLGLNEVALELLGEGKKEFEFKKSHAIKEHEWKDFFEYNMHDSIITYKLAEKLWPDMLEFTKVIQEPLWDITRSGMSQLVEDYILHNLKNFNEIAEKRPLHNEIEARRELGKYEGAFVLQPNPGLYEDVVMFDFTSMYSSVIVTYNLSKSTLLKNRKDERDANEADLGEEGIAYFSTKPGFFPLMLKEMVEKRKKYKAEYKKNENNLTKARSNAYKLLANAAYGYQGFFGARYYSRESAAATAALARKSILETINKIKNEGYEVIMSDTDSIGFKQGNKSKSDVKDFLEKLNKNLPGIMELELEDFYKRGIWVTKRTGESGAKKKYALIDEKSKLKIRGFETVRRDWCDLARELQSKVLELILKEGNEKSALELIKKTIIELKERKINREKILIRTQLKKPLSEYKAITPHVIAAQKMKEAGMPIDIGMSIIYFIAETREKKSLVREKVKLEEEKGEYNIKYYLEHQILPAIENIMQVFNVNVNEIGEKTKQKTLF